MSLASRVPNATVPGRAVPVGSRCRCPGADGAVNGAGLTFWGGGAPPGHGGGQAAAGAAEAGGLPAGSGSDLGAAAPGPCPLPLQLPAQVVAFTLRDSQLFPGTKPGGSRASRLIFWALTPACESPGGLVCFRGEPRLSVAEAAPGATCAVFRAKPLACPAPVLGRGWADVEESGDFFFFFIS